MQCKKQTREITGRSRTWYGAEKVELARWGVDLICAGKYSQDKELMRARKSNSRRERELEERFLSSRGTLSRGAVLLCVTLLFPHSLSQSFRETYQFFLSLMYRSVRTYRYWSSTRSCQESCLVQYIAHNRGLLCRDRLLLVYSHCSTIFDIPASTACHSPQICFIHGIFGC
jgi:hypothetical protein